MYLSAWQLAKFTVWLERQLTTTVPVVMLCDFLFWFQNRFARLHCPWCRKPAPPPNRASENFSLGVFPFFGGFGIIKEETLRDFISCFH